MIQFNASIRWCWCIEERSLDLVYDDVYYRENISSYQAARIAMLKELISRTGSYSRGGPCSPCRSSFIVEVFPHFAFFVFGVGSSSTRLVLIDWSASSHVHCTSTIPLIRVNIISITRVMTEWILLLYSSSNSFHHFLLLSSFLISFLIIYIYFLIEF